MDDYKTEKKPVEESAFKKCPGCNRDIDIYEESCPYCSYHFEGMVYPDRRLELVKDNVSYYKKKFDSLDGGARVTLNWMPLLLGPIWCAYRKMYMIAAMLAGAGMLLTVVEKAFEDSLAVLLICGGLNLALVIIMIMFANGFYSKSLEKRLKKIDEAPEEDRQRLRKKASGTSAAAAWMFVAIIVIVELLPI